MKVRIGGNNEVEEGKEKGRKEVSFNFTTRVLCYVIFGAASVTEGV